VDRCSFAGRDQRVARAGQAYIVLLFADNFGYGELGSYGGGTTRGAPTPRLDALAREGTRLTNFNVEPSCTRPVQR
jgi:arylsulfatase A-like enzyme